MKTRLVDYQELELISNTRLQQKLNKQNPLFWLVHAGKSLAKALIQTDELLVWQKTTCRGDTYWKVYDPATGQTAYFGSEAEVLSWVERR